MLEKFVSGRQTGADQAARRGRRRPRGTHPIAGGDFADDESARGGVTHQAIWTDRLSQEKPITV
jgi:hypothetical protein